MRNLLITGFEPFGGQAVNPSWEAVALLPEIIGQWRLHKLRIPVEYGNAAQKVLDQAKQLGAEAIISVGQAGGRGAVTPELIGINLRDASIADNAGCLYQGSRIDPDGPDGIFSTLPVRKMTEAISAKSIPSKLSYSAGAYVCNDVLYTLLLSLRDTEVRAGFIHVPYIPGQGEPCMALADIAVGLEAAISAL